MQRGRLAVSAGAKIPIVPVEFSPPLNVVNRGPLHTEEVRDLLRGRDVQELKELKELQRQGMSIQEHPGHQQVDRLGPQDDSQVHAGGGVGTGVWPTVSTAEQARCVAILVRRPCSVRKSTSQEGHGPKRDTKKDTETCPFGSSMVS